ncbi:MAG: tetratricopeptide repeat protein [Alphaproteobacteria bacterium]|nr:tetratricopeptide repeat protein [Alphaproteobacteria bacterium]
MKLFGSKNNEEQEDVFADDTADESFDAADVGELDDGAESGGALSAPNRDLGEGGGKSRKGLMLGILGLLLAGGAGGAYYFMTMMDEPAPAPRVAKMIEQPATATAAAPMAVDVTSDILGGPVPPMPETPAEEVADLPAGLADVPDFGALAQADTAAFAADDVLAIVPADSAAGDFMTAADPLEAPGVPPANILGVAPADILGAPPADMAAVPALVDETATSVPAIPADDAGAPDMPANVMADAFAPVAMPDTPPEASPPKEDLPMPRVMDALGAATPPASMNGGAEATNAEKAIVENAAMLDQLSAPAAATAADPAAAGRTVTEILGQPAIVRPMPDSYVIVRKEKDGGALDSRLKTARSALIQNRDMAALQLFGELHQDYPRDTRVGMGRALAMQKLGQHDQALTVYEEVLGNDPKNLEALTNMLGILKLQNPALALEKLIELREAYPFNADIAAQLGVSYAGMQSYAEALKYFDVADALRPGNGYVLYNRAVLHDRMGNEEKAAALYRQIVRMASEGMIKEPIALDAIHRRLSNMR